MSPLSEETVRQALRSVIDRDTGRDVITDGMVSGLTVRGSKVGFMITVEAEDRQRKIYLQAACEQAVSAIPGVESVTAVMTAPSQPPAGNASPRKPAVWNEAPVEHVKKIIAIASGKGGVGKSTTAVNLAHALHALGNRVGLLDADIYGPSIPRMMGLSGQPAIQDGKMMPLVAHGIPCNSMGFITGDEAAIMRGPMITKTLHQLLRMTCWGSKEEPLDFLIVDMPPGTGDIHLSMAQQVPLAGAIIVTTPQEVAVMDARKCALMFQKLGVPVLGVVENMSGSVFGSGGGAALALEQEVPLLATITLDQAICRASDSGQASLNDGYKMLAAKLTAK